jgi:glutathione S-transferase
VTIELFGTLTSPYVRRVRAVAAELSLPVELVDTFTDHGQARMRALNPLWKVPTAVVEGEVVFDSRVIVDHLVRRHGAGKLAPIDAEDLAAHNVVSVIDGALDALINVFYLTRDGLSPAEGSYLAKQSHRVAAAMEWLEAKVDDVWITRTHVFGVPEIALCTALGWMRFRETYPVERHPGLMRCLTHHDERPSLATTRPPA